MNFAKKIVLSLAFFAVSIAGLSGITSASWTSHVQGNDTANSVNQTFDNHSQEPVAYYSFNGTTVYFPSLAGAIKATYSLNPSSNKICNVYTIPDKTHNLEESVELRSYVYLTLPYSGTTWDGSNSNGTEAQYFSSVSSRKNLVTFDENVELTVKNNARVQIGGQINYKGQGVVNAISGNYSEIRLNANSKITLESGSSLYCYGYIKKNTSSTSGTLINAKSGSYVETPMTVYDYKGGTMTSGEDEAGRCPISHFYLVSFHAPLKVDCGAALIALMSLTVSIPLVGDTTATCRVAMITNGSFEYTSYNSTTTDTALILSSGSVTLEYVPETFDTIYPNSSSDTASGIYADLSTMKADLNGVMSVGRINISAGSVMTIDTNKYFYPLGKNFNFTIKNNAVLNVGKKVRFMPGIKVHINQGGTMNVSNQIVLAKSGYYENSTYAYPSKYTKGSQSGSYLPDAELFNNGTINVTGDGVLAGEIKTSVTGATLNYSTSVSSITTYGFKSAEITNTTSGNYIDYSSNAGYSFGNLLVGCQYSSNENYWMGGKSDTFVINYVPIFDGTSSASVLNNPNDTAFNSATTFDLRTNVETNNSDNFLEGFYTDSAHQNSIESFTGSDFVASARSNGGSINIYMHFVSSASVGSTGTIEIYDPDGNLYDRSTKTSDNSLDLSTYATNSTFTDKNIAYNSGNKSFSWREIREWNISKYSDDTLLSSSTASLSSTIGYEEDVLIVVTPTFDNRVSTFGSFAFTTAPTTIGYDDDEDYVATLVYSTALPEEVLPLLTFRFWITNSGALTTDATGNFASSGQVTNSSNPSFAINATVHGQGGGKTAAKGYLNCEVKYDSYTIETVVTSEITQNALTCVVGDTLITLADGTQTRAENLHLGDLLKTWSFEQGCWVVEPIIFFEERRDVEACVIKLTFEDGTYIEITGKQGFFDADSLDYFVVDCLNYEEIIGRRVLAFNGETPVKKTIIQAATEIRVVSTYEIHTGHGFQFVANNVLTIEPLINEHVWFKVNPDYKYDEEAMIQDISTYGVLPYSVFAEYVSEEQYYLFNGHYLAVAIGKGYFTFEELIQIIKQFLPGNT